MIGKIFTNYVAIAISLSLSILVASGLSDFPRLGQVAAGVSIVLLGFVAVRIWWISSAIVEFEPVSERYYVLSNLRSQRRILMLLVIGGIISALHLLAMLQITCLWIDVLFTVLIFLSWLGAFTLTIKHLFMAYARHRNNT